MSLCLENAPSAHCDGRDGDRAFDFTVPTELSAREPAEARGLRRDQVRMLVGRVTGPRLSHHRVADLPDVLQPGDLLVVNNSGTLPAALEGRLGDGMRVAVHVSGAEPGPDGDHLVELRRPRLGSSVPFAGPSRSELSALSALSAQVADAGGAAARSGATIAPFERSASPARPGLELRLPGGGVLELTRSFTERLWYARFRLPGSGGGESDSVVRYLARRGKPIRYSYVDRDWPLAAYQTVFAVEPGSSEMPSAARPFTPELVAGLVARGILIAPITLHTGVASPEAHEAPYPERYRVPKSTARLVNHVRASAGRVVAVGTTVVRALESAVDGGGLVRAADGWTGLVITPQRGVRAVDGLLTGWHEPRASHLLMLEAVAGRPLLDLCYAEAIRENYLWHEFGDVNLLLNTATRR
jgi:S-adenosylmethionine:tRNA ribosyltransferase-isomerase